MANDDGKPTLQFRIAVIEDAPQLQHLVQSAFRSKDTRDDWTGHLELASHFRVSIDEIETNIAKSDMVTLVAYLEDPAVAVGTVEVAAHSGNVGRLSMVAVDPGLQQGGVGRQVLAYAEKYCHQIWGSDKFSLNALSTRKALIEWYLRRGYRKTGETSPFPRDKFPELDLPEDMCFIELEKNLN